MTLGLGANIPSTSTLGWSVLAGKSNTERSHLFCFAVCAYCPESLFLCSLLPSLGLQPSSKRVLLYLAARFPPSLDERNGVSENPLLFLTNTFSLLLFILYIFAQIIQIIMTNPHTPLLFSMLQVAFTFFSDRRCLQEKFYSLTLLLLLSVVPDAFFLS